MKFANLSKVVGAGAIAASLAVVPLTLPAHAQNNGTDTYTQNQNTQTNSDVRDVETYNDSNWGWLGLLGIAGLAGLARKKRHETHSHRISNDPNVVVRSGSDYR
jgi:MYXO-CTERM domain-containing protein